MVAPDLKAAFSCALEFVGDLLGFFLRRRKSPSGLQCVRRPVVLRVEVELNLAFDA